MPSLLAKPTPWWPGINLEHLQARGLVGAWLFNEGAGSRLRDLSVRGNTSVLTNMDPKSNWVGSDQGFELDFVGGSSQYVAIDDLVIDSFPMTVHVWTNVTNKTIFSIANSGSDLEYVSLEIRDSHVSAVLRSGGFVNVETTATIPVGDFLASAVWISQSDVRVYLNGTNEVSGSGFSGWPSGLNRSAIGALYRSTIVDWVTGGIRFASVYNIAQTAAEVKAVYDDLYAPFREPDPVELWDVAAPGGTIASQLIQAYRRMAG